jgi:DNA-binding MarR family transcriptional regulator
LHIVPIFAQCDIPGMSTTDPNRVDESLIALRRILRATDQYERDLASAAGLSPAQLRVLQIIAGKPGGTVTPKALAQQMGVTQATVTSVVDKLVARAFVVRQPSETDRRQTNVVLTETGRAALDEAPDALQQRYVREFVKLADWEQAQLVASLERVAAMMDAHLMDASPVLTMGEITGVGKRK